MLSLSLKRMMLTLSKMKVTTQWWNALRSLMTSNGMEEDGKQVGILLTSHTLTKVVPLKTSTSPRMHTTSLRPSTASVTGSMRRKATIRATCMVRSWSIFTKVSESKMEFLQPCVFLSTISVIFISHFMLQPE